MNQMQQMKTKQTALEIETSDNTKSAQLLKEQFSIQQLNGKIIIPFQSKEQSAAVNKMLLQHNIDVYTLHPQQSDLEQLFIDITSNDK